MEIIQNVQKKKLNEMQVENVGNLDIDKISREKPKKLSMAQINFNAMEIQTV